MTRRSAVSAAYRAASWRSRSSSPSTSGAASVASASAAPFAFQPIGIQRINLPSAVKSAGWPVFTHDGQHLLFFSTASGTPGGSTGPGATAALWIASLHGGHAHCLSCGLANDPTSSGEGEITPFSGRQAGVLRLVLPARAQATTGCSSAVRASSIAPTPRSSPVDFSAAEPQLIPAGGKVSSPADQHRRCVRGQALTGRRPRRILRHPERQHRDDGDRDAHADRDRVQGHRPARHQPTDPTSWSRRRV